MSIGLTKVNSIAIIGECMLELNLPSALPESSAAAAVSCNLSYGGDTLNTAVYMSRLGLDVQYVTALGDDGFSEYLLQQWRAEGVGCEMVKRATGRLPGLYAIETDSQGERSFHYWRDQAPVRQLLSSDTERQQLFEKLRSFSMVYLSGISLSLFTTAEVEQLLAFLRDYKEQGGIVVFDSNYRPKRWPDDNEARRLFDLAYSVSQIALSTLDDEKLLRPRVSEQQVIERLQGLGVEEIVLKKGEQGSSLVYLEQKQSCAAGEIEQVVDTTAAGDSFNAAYLAARCRGLDCFSAAQQGHRLAGLVVQQAGAIISRQSMSQVIDLSKG